MNFPSLSTIINAVSLSFIVIILIIGCATIGFILGKTHFKPNKFLETEINYDRVSTVDCESNSMGLTINCDDQAYIQHIDTDSVFELGGIYIYTKGNKTIIHRLVYCIDVDCNQTIFKGDNNAYGEEVNRSQIIGKVIKVAYY
jgi:hypothetical protein